MSNWQLRRAAVCHRIAINGDSELEDFTTRANFKRAVSDDYELLCGVITTRRAVGGSSLARAGVAAVCNSDNLIRNDGIVVGRKERERVTGKIKVHSERLGA